MTPRQFVETDNKNFFRVHRQVYVCEDTWRRELTQIFDKCWLYAGHASEFGKPGDFLTRKIGGRPVILVRDVASETPLAFLNACAHRGAVVCSDAKGTTKRFACPYHGWMYDTSGALTGVPGRSAYGRIGEGLPERSLPQIKLDDYRGFLFISFGEPSASLASYLGGAKEYIDLVCDQSEGSVEVLPEHLHHSIRANWKLLAENGVDAYHLPIAHKRFLDLLDSLGTDPNSHKRSGIGYALGGGHAVIKSGPPSTGRPIAYWSPLFPAEMKAEIDKKFDDLVARVGRRRAEDMAHTNRSLFIFPNLVINDILGLNIRTFFPTSPDEVEVTVWGAGFSDETTEERAMRVSALISFIGPGGFGTPDDVEILESCQRSYAHAGIGYSDFSRGMSVGTTNHTDEEQNRAFWREWANYVEQP
nr:aromatic ring-hydroxylating dioxygenase subunit alpha [Methylocystis sp. Sn-Cys]